MLWFNAILKWLQDRTESLVTESGIAALLLSRDFIFERAEICDQLWVNNSATLNKICLEYKTIICHLKLSATNRIPSTGE